MTRSNSLRSFFTSTNLCSHTGAPELNPGRPIGVVSGRGGPPGAPPGNELLPGAVGAPAVTAGGPSELPPGDVGSPFMPGGGPSELPPPAGAVGCASAFDIHTAPPVTPSAATTT